MLVLTPKVMCTPSSLMLRVRHLLICMGKSLASRFLGIDSMKTIFRDWCCNRIGFENVFCICAHFGISIITNFLHWCYSWFSEFCHWERYCHYYLFSLFGRFVRHVLYDALKHLGGSSLAISPCLSPSKFSWVSAFLPAPGPYAFPLFPCRFQGPFASTPAVGTDPHLNL